MLQGLLSLGTKTAVWLLDWLESIIVKKPVISQPAPVPAILPLEPITPDFDGDALSQQPTPSLVNPWVEIPGFNDERSRIEIPEVSEVPSATVDQLLEPTPTRRELVEALLDEAWQQGITSYTALTQYVKDQSGTACSRKVISAWKKSRQANTEVTTA